MEAISNAIAAVKLAPLRNSDRANATAAYEHDEDAAPKPVASASVRGRSSPRSRTMVDFLTTAWTTADSANPRISAQVITQVIDQVMDSACTMAPTSLTSPGPRARVLLRAPQPGVSWDGACERHYRRAVITDLSRGRIRGPSASGPEYVGAACFGPEYVGAARFGPQFVGAACFGPEYVGAARFGPQFVGAARFGPEYVSAARLGVIRAVGIGCHLISFSDAHSDLKH